MGQKGRNTLKEYFEAGKMPTEQEFADLMDSSLNQVDDQLTVKTQGTTPNEAKYFGIGSIDPQSPLSIKAHEASENLISFEDTQGQQTWQINQQPEGNSGLNIAETGVDPSRLFIQSSTGNIGIGNTDPQARLHTNGSGIIEQDLEVNGNLELANGNPVDTITDHIDVTTNNYRDHVIPTEKALQDYIDALFTGTVNAFAVNTPPQGWIECNGQAISRTDYTRLFQVIGDQFGAGDGTTTFNVPDLRGEFIRGWDHGRGVDQNRAFGNHQQDEMQSHTHDDTGHSHSDAGHSHTDAGHAHHTYHGNHHWPGGAGAELTLASWGNWSANHGSQANIQTSYASITTGYSSLTDPVISGSTGGVPRHGPETRPVNVSLMYCIKY